MYKESFQALLEQAVGYQVSHSGSEIRHKVNACSQSSALSFFCQKRTQNKIENMSRLLKEAQSITNEDQLVNNTFLKLFCGGSMLFFFVVEKVSLSTVNLYACTTVNNVWPLNWLTHLLVLGHIYAKS